MRQFHHALRTLFFCDFDKCQQQDAPSVNKYTNVH